MNLVVVVSVNSYLVAPSVIVVERLVLVTSVVISATLIAVTVVVVLVNVTALKVGRTSIGATAAWQDATFEKTLKFVSKIQEQPNGGKTPA